MDYSVQLNKWQRMISELFPKGIPDKADWGKKEDIISVLDFIGKNDAYNHIFLPGSGGLDLEGAREAYEEGLIDLQLDNTAYLLKPSQLHFRKTPNLNWSYFYLETKEISYTGVYGDRELSVPGEELVEFSPGNYIDRGYWDEGEYNGETLPGEARLISRYTKGNFVIFSKSSIYNRTSGTYDGRHDKLGFSEFEKYINQAVNSR
ncbi:serine/threonine protein kinase [Oceanobacillus salinisoli]|uniref:serine/threonine protein kinase n=1 Tax=Oceanobacillus salinisoli TaxID=2678611 RepID=UPI0012E15530|nr:serine/threonine protein kinase [Oceanobacillus salinisoli]